ncbi:Anaphase-promoting complex subunit 13 [Anthophora plagiata]
MIDIWDKVCLPMDDIIVPLAELPDPENDNGDSHMTLKELEQKWNNIALGILSENHSQKCIDNAVKPSYIILGSFALKCYRIYCNIEIHS